MARPIHPNFRIAQAAKDSPIRTLCEAQAEQRSDIRRLREHFESADGWVHRTHDFPAGNVLDALGETTEVTLSPGGQAASGTYELRYSVSINPVVPSSGVNKHHIEVSAEVDVAGTGTWAWQCAAVYDQTRKTGEPNAAVVRPVERLVVNITGLSTSSKIRLKITEASGPGGWSFAVHGFNATTDGDPVGIATKPVVSSSVANPSVITTSEMHLLHPSYLVRIAGHTGSTPDINGTHVATVTGPTTFTIPVNVTAAGSGGTVRPVIPGVRYHTGPGILLNDAGGVGVALHSSRYKTARDKRCSPRIRPTAPALLLRGSQCSPGPSFTTPRCRN